jgi:hypothetical protein
MWDLVDLAAPTSRLMGVRYRNGRMDSIGGLSLCARLHPAFIQLDDKIYVGMGNKPNNFKDWWEYDIPTDTWTQKDDLPGPSRHHPFYFGIGDIAYVGFGHGNNFMGNLSIYNDFYQFDPATDEWTQLNDFPGEAVLRVLNSIIRKRVYPEW